VSPDGSKFAFVEAQPGGNRPRLALKRLDRDDLVPIPGTDGANSPFFSPDGGTIAFADGPRLRSVRLDGSGGSTIVDMGGADDIGSGSWSPEGTIVFSGRSSNYLYTVAATGGTPRRLPRSFRALTGTPAWLPGGKRILLTLDTPGRGDFDMLVVDATTGDSLASPGPGIGLRFVESGDLAYLSAEGSVMGVPFDAKRLRATGPAVVVAQASISYLGRSLPVDVSSNGTVAYSVSLERTNKELALVEKGQATVLPLGSRNFRGPRFSPDGRRIVFASTRDDEMLTRSDVFVMNADGTGVRNLSRHPNEDFNPHWTSDGRRVVFASLRSGTSQLFEVDLDSGQTRRLTNNTSHDMDHAPYPAPGG
jgi:Tol biopolymer transport system component